jgi:hypothetical protein
MVFYFKVFQKFFFSSPQHAKYKLALLLLPILSIPNPFQMDTLKLGVDLR